MSEGDPPAGRDAARARHPHRRADRGAAGRRAEQPRRRRFTIDTAPLRERPFRRLWTGQAITVVGTQMTLVVVPYQVFTVTRSSLAVGLTSIVALVPLVVFGLIGGAIADTVDRRKLMLFTSGGTAVASGLLLAQSLLPGPGHLCGPLGAHRGRVGPDRDQLPDPERRDPGAGRQGARSPPPTRST